MVDNLLIKEFIYIYLIVINVISLSCFFIDKKRAQKQLYRISESFLLQISLIGGALGAFLGMKLFHHKTKKKKFIIAIPFLIVINIVSFIYLQQLLTK